jgi:cytoskeletal protein RodZ
VRKIFRIAQLSVFLVAVGYIVVLLLGGRVLTNFPFAREILVLRKQIAEVAVRLPPPAPIASLQAETNEPSPSPESPEPSPSPVTAEPFPSRATAETSPSPVTAEPSPSPATTEPSPAPTAAATTGPNTARVDSISYGTYGGKNKDLHLMIAIRVVDASGKAVSGATVSIDVSLDVDNDGTYERTPYATRKGLTDSLGQLTLRVNEAPSGCYVTGVSGVSADGLVWNEVTPPHGPKCK